MSKWIKAQFTLLESVDKPILCKALEEMGLTLNEDDKEVSRYRADSACDAVLYRGETKLELGMRFEQMDDRTRLQLIGDFWTTGLSQEEFVQDLSQIYKKHDCLEKLSMSGCVVENIYNEENGNIVIEAYQEVYA